MLINGQPASSIAASDRGLQYGDGVFETIAVIDGRPCLWSWHMQRLNRGCERLRIQCPDPELLYREALSVSDRPGYCVLKIIVTRGAAGRGYLPNEQECSPTRILAAFDWPPGVSWSAPQSVRLCICTVRLAVNPLLAGIKHLNRLEQVLAAAECHERGYEEGLMLDTNELVIEGTRSNVFLVRDHRLYTPDLQYCGIDGVVRELLIENVIDHELPVTVTKLTLADIQTADEIFICNSIMGIRPVVAVDGHDTAGTAVSTALSRRLARVMTG